MVLLVHSYGFWLALALLCVSPAALAAGPSVPPYLRTALDDDAPARGPREPRRIRSSLDDASHASFPVDSEGRLIRISLDDGGPSYGRLTPMQSRARRVRTALD
jgi:hypothetical protein